MSAPAFSIFVFGIYIILVGVSLYWFPNKVLEQLKFPTTEEPWVRMQGFVLTALGFYYIIAAQYELIPFFWATVIGRSAVLPCFILLVVYKNVTPKVIFFGAFDALGAIWTLYCFLA